MFLHPNILSNGKVAINAYSQKLQLFFLTLENSNGSSNNCNLLVVDMNLNHVLYNVNVAVVISLMTFDDASLRLFVWYATDIYASALSVLDYTTGSISVPIYTSPNLTSNRGANTYVSHTHILYAQLNDINNSNWPTWVSVNVVSGRSSNVTVPCATKFSWILSIASF
jgi:hypothetical protein